MAHRALAVAEIIHTILEYLNSGSIYKSRKDFRSVALCCRSLQEPALSFLWRNMISIIPLLKLLPGLQEINNNLMLLGPVNPESSPRFFYYNYRVRALIYLTNHAVLDWEKIHPSTCMRLAQLEHGLVPNLRLLNIEMHPLFLDGSPPSLPLWHSNQRLAILPCLIKSRSLDSLTFVLNNDVIPDSDVGAISTVLFDITANIRFLNLDGKFAPTYLGSILHFPHLQELRLCLSSHSWSFDDICALSSLKYLHTLDLDTREIEFRPGDLHVTCGFPSLATFTFKGRFSVVLSLLDIFPENLDAVRMTISNDTSEPQVVAVQWAFYCQKLSRFQALRELHIHLVGHRDTKPIESSPMALLSKLVHLEGLSLSTGSIFSFGHSDIVQIANSFPQIQVLSLMVVTRPCVQLATLKHLSRKCPRLTDLFIAVHEGEICSILPDAPATWHGLDNLELGGSTFEHPMTAALHLDRIFPNIRELSCDDGDLEEKLREAICEVCPTEVDAVLERQWLRLQMEKDKVA